MLWKVLHSICTMHYALNMQYACSQHHHTIALISHASKVMLKILQVRLQRYMNHEFPDVQAGFKKARGTRHQIVNIRWITEKAREFQKNIYFCFTDYAKAFDCVDHIKLWKILKKDKNTSLLRNLFVGQEAIVRLGKEYIKAIYCYSVYITSMQSTS